MLYTMNYPLSSLVSLILNEPNPTHYTAKNIKYTNEKIHKNTQMRHVCMRAQKIPAILHTCVYIDSTPQELQSD